jgi:phosphatidate phosphatase APP1
MGMGRAHGAVGWRWRPITAARDVERWLDSQRFAFKRRFGLLGRFEILPYRGHGTERRLFLRGRVLEEEGVSRSTRDDTIAENLRNMARRFNSGEVAGARVRASFRHLEAHVTADEEGFFDVGFELEESLNGPGSWHEVELHLLHPPSPGGGPVRSTGQVLVPSGAEFGVISDLDDTVVHSRATNVLKMAWIVVRNNAHTRLPFEGVSAFYEALRRGPGGEGDNPIFYVSSSPWNIYDLLEDFLDVHRVPAGPLFLKDWSPTTLGKHHDHKLGIIRTLLETYPELPFILIGDSGEKDPEIYHQAVIEHPGRIQAIYIRDVTSDERDLEVHAIAEKLRDHDVEMVLTADTVRAAEHAANLGLIPPEAVGRVRARRDAPG